MKEISQDTALHLHTKNKFPYLLLHIKHLLLQLILSLRHLLKLLVVLVEPRLRGLDPGSEGTDLGTETFLLGDGFVEVGCRVEVDALRLDGVELWKVI